MTKAEEAEDLMDFGLLGISGLLSLSSFFSILASLFVLALGLGDVAKWPQSSSQRSVWILVMIAAPLWGVLLFWYIKRHRLFAAQPST